MENVMTLSIPNGYEIIRKKYKLDVDEAVKILTSRKKKNYIHAYREGFDTTVVLRKDVWRCPFCNNEIPATAFDSKGKLTKFGNNLLHVDRNTIKNWGSRQMTIFQNEPSDLFLNHTYRLKGEICCPKCQNHSAKAAFKRNVVIFYDETQVSLKAEVVGIGEILSIPWIEKTTLSLNFPIFEIVTFDFNAGKTHIKLVDGKNTIIAIRDISTEPYLWQNSITYDLLNRNVIINRNIKRIFSNIIKNPFPFTGDELTPDRFVQVAVFPGYNRSFYDAIPYVKGTFEIDASFNDLLSELKNDKIAISFFENSELPKCKSVKKLFFTNPGLLFYICECEQLWFIISDVNHFCFLFNRDEIFHILSILHQRPVLFKYLTDYKKVKGSKNVILKMIDDWKYTIDEPVNYCTMNDYLKLAEQKKWKEKPIKRKQIQLDDEDFDEDDFIDDEMEYRYSREISGFSIPMKKPPNRIFNCRIDEYSFSWLKTGNEYYIVGEELKNCLRSWKSTNNPVVVVKKDNKVVAAIEVNEGTVIQVKGYKNSSISRVPSLSKAYDKWCEKFDLKENIYDFED